MFVVLQVCMVHADERPRMGCTMCLPSTGGGGGSPAKAAWPGVAFKTEESPGGRPEWGDGRVPIHFFSFESKVHSCISINYLIKHLHWSIIALQWCVSFCFITKWISYTYTYIPISPPSCVSLPPSLSHPSRWSQSTELISLCYVAASH